MSSYHEQVICIGNKVVIVAMHENIGKQIFLRIHENESAAGVVGRRLAAEGIGSFIDLIHTKKRTISFVLDGVEYSFDPNRIFSTKGIQLTLTTNECMFVPAHVSAYVARFGKQILQSCGEVPIIALHNNKGDEYTLASYEVGGSEHLADGKTFLHVEDGDRSNFVVTTQKEVFEKLLDAKVSVVYQVYDEQADDGSLSCYCAKYGISYCNIETLYEAVHRQYEIANIVAEIFSTQGR